MSNKNQSLKISTISFRSFILFCLFSLIFACHPAPPLKIPPVQLEPDKILESAISNQNQIETLTSLINFNLKSSRGSYSGDLELYLKKPDSLAFRIKAFLGPDLMEAVIFGDNFLFYFPRLKRYYEGDNLSCSEDEILRTEINLFCLLKILTLETQLKKVGTIYRGRDRKNFIYEQRGRVWKKSFWVDANDSYLRKCMWEEVDYSSPEEARGFVIEYKDHTKISGIKIPREIKIKSLDEKEKLRLKFLETKINSKISEKKFQIKIPEEAKSLEIE